jgi:hypothetical protein
MLKHNLRPAPNPRTQFYPLVAHMHYILNVVNRILRILHGNRGAILRLCVCGGVMHSIGACYDVADSQAAESASKESLRLESPNVNPKLAACTDSSDYRGWRKGFHAILAEKNYDLEKQRQIHNSAILLRQQPYEHLLFLVEGLDKDAYSLTYYAPGNCVFMDMSVGDVCEGILRETFGRRVYDVKGDNWTTYLEEVIGDKEPTSHGEGLDFTDRSAERRAELKNRMKKWLEQRKGMAPWEIQYEVLKWTFDKTPKYAAKYDKMPGTNAEDFYRFHQPDTKEVYRQMQIVKEAKRSIQFSVGKYLDLIDYMSGLYDAK